MPCPEAAEGLAPHAGPGPGREEGAKRGTRGPLGGWTELRPPAMWVPDGWILRKTG